jgi:hypothetical protein
MCRVINCRSSASERARSANIFQRRPYSLQRVQPSYWINRSLKHMHMARPPGVPFCVKSFVSTGPSGRATEKSSYACLSPSTNGLSSDKARLGVESSIHLSKSEPFCYSSQRWETCAGCKVCVKFSASNYRVGHRNAISQSAFEALPTAGCSCR